MTSTMEYQGNVYYCYSDATAMFLTAHGEQGIGAGLVEVLTGQALTGAVRVDDKIYFSADHREVPARISKALELLGFTSTAKSSQDSPDVAELLRADLADGPVLLGPLDQAHLPYVPADHQHATVTTGHYAVAYGIDDEQVFLHDPLGFPCAVLSFDDLRKAWGPGFHRWVGLHRISQPSAGTLYRQAIEHFDSIQRETPPGEDVIRQFAKDIRAENLEKSSLEFLANFTFPLETRRRLDYAAFFERNGDNGSAALKQQQAELFGDCLQAAHFSEWPRVADKLDELADLERLLAQHRWIRDAAPAKSARPMPPRRTTEPIEYHGNVYYCYSDATAMFLTAHGERGVTPGLVEVLSGISLLGGLRNTDPRGDKIFFSMAPKEVPTRINKALDLLGLTYTTKSGPDDVPVTDLLREDLANGPVLLGPMDMGYLTYIPYHQFTGGADHYLVAYAMGDDGVRLHDPLGFPCATLNFDDLKKAWRARSIGYAGGPFHRWLSPQRTDESADGRLYHRAIEYFASVQREVPPGDEVMRQAADDMRAGNLPNSSLAFLSVFAFSVQSRRGLDYALFFERAGETGLAAVKRRQAQLYSDCHRASNVGDWTRVAGKLDELADLEQLVAGYRWVTL